MFVSHDGVFAAIHAELDRVAVEGLTRAQAECLVGELARVESHVRERMLAAMAAIDSLGDGGVGSDGVTRARANTSVKAAKKAKATAGALAEMPRARTELAAGEMTGEHVDALAGAADRVDPVRADAVLTSSAALIPADRFAKQCRNRAARNEPADTAVDRYRHQRAGRTTRVWENTEGMT